MSKHMWEAEHAYYCNEGNYFTADEVGTHYKSFQEFLSSEGESDMDYNLLFRWDWLEGSRDDEAAEFNGDIYYRNGLLKLFWMGQRKGLYRYTVVEVCRADEQMVMAFLKPRFAHLMSLWAPLGLSDTSEAA